MSCLVIFRDWLIRARPKEFDEFSKALAVENHRCGLLRFEPALKMLAKGRPHDLFAKKLLMQSIQDRLRLLQCPLVLAALWGPKTTFAFGARIVIFLLWHHRHRRSSRSVICILESGNLLDAVVCP